MLLGGPHFPKSGVQRLPQWAVELPHQPWVEQQSPKALPPQTNLFVPPQEPSGETLPGPGGVSGAGAAALQLPALFWLCPVLAIYRRHIWHKDRDLPAVSAEFARSTTYSVLGATSSPDGTADEASVAAAGAIRGDLSSLPW